jgi:HEPN domain-containing protein
MNRSYDWIKQAERDLDFAKETISKGYYDWKR